MTNKSKLYNKGKEFARPITWHLLEQWAKEIGMKPSTAERTARDLVKKGIKLKEGYGMWRRLKGKYAVFQFLKETKLPESKKTIHEFAEERRDKKDSPNTLFD